MNIDQQIPKVPRKNSSIDRNRTAQQSDSHGRQNFTLSLRRWAKTIPAIYTLLAILYVKLKEKLNLKSGGKKEECEQTRHIITYVHTTFIRGFFQKG